MVGKEVLCLSIVRFRMFCFVVCFSVNDLEFDGELGRCIGGEYFYDLFEIVG